MYVSFFVLIIIERVVFLFWVGVGGEWGYEFTVFWAFFVCEVLL